MAVSHVLRQAGRHAPSPALSTEPTLPPVFVDEAIEYCDVFVLPCAQLLQVALSCLHAALLVPFALTLIAVHIHGQTSP